LSPENADRCWSRLVPATAELYRALPRASSTPGSTSTALRRTCIFKPVLANESLLDIPRHRKKQTFVSENVGAHPTFSAVDDGWIPSLCVIPMLPAAFE